MRQKTELIGAIERYFISELEKDQANVILLLDYAEYIESYHESRRGEGHELLDKAFNMASENIENATRLHESYTIRGYIKRWRGDVAGATLDLEEALKSDPLYSRAVREYWWCLNSGARKGECAEFLSSRIKLCELYMDENSLYIRAFCYKKLHERYAAEDAYNHGLLLYPDARRLKISLANMLLDYNESYDKAFTLLKFNQMNDLVLEYVHALYSLVSSYLEKKMYLEAIDVCDYLIEIDVFCAEFQYMRGEAYRLLGDKGLAEQDFRKAIRYNQKHAEAYSSLAYIMLYKEELETAERLFKHALELGVDCEDFTLKHLGVCAYKYYGRQDMESSSQLLDYIHKIRPAHYDTHARKVHLTSDLKVKQRNIREALKYYPRDVFFLIEMLKTMDFDEKLKQMEVVDGIIIEDGLNTNKLAVYYDALLDIAKQYQEFGLYENAIHYFARARTYYVSSSSVLYDQACCYRAKGLTGEALKLLFEALTLKSNYQKAVIAIIEISALSSIEEKKKIFQFLANLNYLDLTITDLFTKEVLEQIFEYIATSKSLNELVLSEVEDYMLSALEKNTSIKLLSAMGQVSAEALHQIVTKNTSIMILDAPPEAMSADLEHAITKNTKIISCSNAMLRKGSYSFMAEMIERCNKLKYPVMHMLAKPKILLQPASELYALLENKRYIFREVFPHLTQTERDKKMLEYEENFTTCVNKRYYNIMFVLLNNICKESGYAFRMPLDVIRNIVSVASMEAKCALVDMKF